MELVAVRNRAEAVWRRQQGQAAHTRLKEARKDLKRAVHEAKMTDIAEKIAGCSGTRTRTNTTPCGTEASAAG